LSKRVLAEVRIFHFSGQIEKRAKEMAGDASNASPCGFDFFLRKNAELRRKQN